MEAMAVLLTLMLMLKMIDVVAAIIEQGWPDSAGAASALRPPAGDVGVRRRQGWSRVKASRRRSPRTAGGDGHHRPPGLLYRQSSAEVSGRRIHLHARWVPHFQARRWPTITPQLRWCLPTERWPRSASRPIFLLHAFIAQRPPPFPSA